MLPKIRGTLLGVPIIRIIVFWGLYWGPLILGNYPIPAAFWGTSQSSAAVDRDALDSSGGSKLYAKTLMPFASSTLGGPPTQ